MTTVNFDYAMLQRFKRAFKKATKESKEVFIFEGNEFVIGYAKYLIEYLEEQFKKGGN
jgi:hypothetical protein